MHKAGRHFAALRRLFAFTAASIVALASSDLRADPFPAGGQGQNIEQVGFSALDGRYGGFKIAIKHTTNDKWYLYTGHSFNQGWSIVDVTDPKNPRFVKFIPYVTDDKTILTAQVTLHDNLMITSLNSFGPQKDPKPAILLWDISDPENPTQVGSWMGGDTGAHRNSYPGGKYAYLSTSYPGFKLHIMVILDVSDPAHPKEVGKWWQPGQKDGEPPSQFPEGFHGPVNVSPDGKMASFGYTPDVVNLDISDPTNPKLIGKVHITDPFASVGMQSVHTVLPLWDRKLLYVSSEAQKERCLDNGMNFAGMIDNSDPAKPRLISIFPTPVPPPDAPYKDFCDKGGRFGPHNTSQEIHNPAIQQPANLMYVAWFNAGLRVFDISDARLPKEVAYFMPPERPGLPSQAGAHASEINWSEELAVDSRGYIYMNDDSGDSSYCAILASSRSEGRQRSLRGVAIPRDALFVDREARTLQRSGQISSCWSPNLHSSTLRISVPDPWLSDLGVTDDGQAIFGGAAWYYLCADVSCRGNCGESAPTVVRVGLFHYSAACIAVTC